MGLKTDSLVVRGNPVMVGVVTVTDLIHLQHQELAGVPGGTLTLNAWTQRKITNEVLDTGGNCTLAANVFTLLAGTYNVKAYTSGQNLGHNILRLYDNTGAAELVLGLTHWQGSSNGRSMLWGQFTLTVDSAVELQHIQSGTAGTDNMGVSNGYGGLNPTAVYADVWIERLVEEFVPPAPPPPPDIADLAGLAWEAKGDASATQSGGVNTDITYNTGTVDTIPRALYGTVDGSAPVEIQARATPSGAVPNNATLGVYLEDVAGDIIQTSIFEAAGFVRSYQGTDISALTLLASRADNWDLDSVVRVFRGMAYEEFSVKDLSVNGPFFRISDRAINTSMGVPVLGGLVSTPPASGSFNFDVTKLRIGSPEVLPEINGVYNLGSLTARNSNGGSPLTSNQPTQDQATGVISMPSRGAAQHTGGVYMPTDEADGDLVLAVTVAPSGTSRLSAACIFDVTGDLQKTWGPLHDGKIYLHNWAGFVPGTNNNITHAWNPTTDRVRIQVTATQLRYDLSTNSGSSWVTHFTETRGAEHATPEAMGAMVFASGVAAGVAGTITEMSWTPA